MLAQRPEVKEALQPHSFEAEVCKLLLRYKQGARVEGTRRKVDMKNHWATPAGVMHTLKQHLGIDKERFASPLNFSGSTRTYWSCFERDQLFGAQHDAYSCQWSGHSECNPEYEHADMYKAVGWAVKSARATAAPTVTLCILPAWDQSSDTSYLRWMREAPANCHHLMRVPRQLFKFRVPDAWKRASEYAGHPKWDINLLLVGNQAGFESLAGIDETRLCADVAAQLAPLASGNAPKGRLLRNNPARALDYRSFKARAAAGPPQAVPCTRKFRAAPPEGTARPPSHGPRPSVRDLYAATSELLVDPDQLIYSDGSVMDGTNEQRRHADEGDSQTAAAAPTAARRQLVAAAIYVPGKSRRDLRIPEDAGYADTAPGEATGTYVYIDPAGRPPAQSPGQRVRASSLACNTAAI